MKRCRTQRSRRFVLLALGLLPLLTTMPATAHHSLLAEFDPEKTVELTGVVAKIEWTNPHTYIYMDVRTGGGMERWAWQLASPNGLVRHGWSPNSIQVGDRITVNGTPARDGSRKANTRSVLLGDGQMLSATLGEKDEP